jgi:hypothetical protein
MVVVILSFSFIHRRHDPITGKVQFSTLTTFKVQCAEFGSRVENMPKVHYRTVGRASVIVLTACHLQLF